MIKQINIKEKIAQDIANFGFSIVEVSDDGMPDFGYTTGLFRSFNHPEIVILGLPKGVLLSILSEIGEYVQRGKHIKANQNYLDVFIKERPVRFLEAKQEFHENYLGWASWYNQGQYPVLQMIWPDRSNNFPWENNFDIELLTRQPLLDREVEYKFREKRNLGVYTTRQVIDENLPILYAYHENDGDWQFLCGSTNDVSDLRIVALEEILKRDSTLNALSDLPEGWRAHRESPKLDWSIELDEN